MKTYLVGGAVRDQCLNLPVVERDWVVVGATPKSLLEQGYRQVGRDFPVFLHPKTQEEYALARTERKSGKGYYGFECEYAPDVSLEDDLQRRDLTINAMAMDEKGTIIDPYGGLHDLAQKKLRHVSSAFVEDPVRVLRVARFAARFHHLGFRVADETRRLMYQMVSSGELSHLVPERVWQELERALGETNPEQCILTLRASGALKVILPEIDVLFGVPASPHHHPEIDTGIHTLMVLEAISKITPDSITRFAALVHDVGKAATPIGEWPSHKDHDTRGTVIIDTLCKRLRVPSIFHKFAKKVCEQHLNIHRLSEMPADAIVSILNACDAFRQGALFDKLLEVCRADSGREHYEQREKWQYLLQECLNINAKELVRAGFQGLAIKNELHARRVARVQNIITTWETTINEKQYQFNLDRLGNDGLKA